MDRNVLWFFKKKNKCLPFPIYEHNKPAILGREVKGERQMHVDRSIIFITLWMKHLKWVIWSNPPAKGTYVLLETHTHVCHPVLSNYTECRATWCVCVCVCESLSHVWLFCNLMDCNLPGSSVHGILQARIMEWVAIYSSRGSSWPRDWTWVSCMAGGFFTLWAARQAHSTCLGESLISSLSFLRNHCVCSCMSKA